MVCGSTTIGRSLTTSGIRTTSSYSVSETVFFSASQFHSRRFFFSGLSRLFFQPPNILPVSSSFFATSSQLLVNIYMNEFDHFLKRELKIQYCVRYADDFVILHESKEYLQKILPKISEFLESYLKLSLHPDKVFIKTIASGVDFLGWIHFPHHRVPRTSTKRRMLKNLARNPRPGSLASYQGLLSHGNTHKLQQKISIQQE
jgi:hypothetical protein